MHPGSARVEHPRASSLQVVAVIPARFASTRFPGKALATIDGRPMIAHVYERTAQCRAVSRVIVATDDRRIADAVCAFGGEVRMTRGDHSSGTDRIAEIAATLDCDIVVNVQGDEPMISPDAIAAAIEPFATDAGVETGATAEAGTPPRRSSPDLLQMTTLYTRIDDPADLRNPNVVKVVLDRAGYALYFSRAAIPYVRDGGWPPLHKHIGLYAYRRKALLVLASLDQTPLERAEALEQLRALEHGIRIKAVATTYDSVHVDTPEDLVRVRQLMAATAQAGPYR